MPDTTIPAPEEFALEGLRANLRGALIRPADDGYDEAST